jgi:hypothetical protein
MKKILSLIVVFIIGLFNIFAIDTINNISECVLYLLIATPLNIFSNHKIDPKYLNNLIFSLNKYDLNK